MNLMLVGLICLVPSAAPRWVAGDGAVTPYRMRSAVCTAPRFWASTEQSQTSSYDYRRQFDYPWQMRPVVLERATTITAPTAVPEGARSARPQPEVIPTREPNSK